MYAYALLEPGFYYLIQEKKEEPISLIRVNVETDHCLFVSRFTDQELVEWKRKTDPIHDIIELLSDEAAEAWEESFNARYDLEEDDEGSD